MKSLLAICLLSLASFSYAQETSDTFQIKDYKYRTPGFKALSFDFNFSGGFRREGVVDSINNTQNSFGLSPANFNFYKVSSSDSRLHQSTYIFTIEGYTNRVKTPHQETKQKHGTAYFDWSTNTQYFRKNNWFWELGNRLKILGDFGKNFTEPVTYRQSDIYINDNPVIGLGKGRLEMVNDAQMALFILNDLEAQGLIINKGSREQQNAFAQVITDINNQRVFDDRKKRIYELRRIDSFIKNSGLSISTDIRHFTTINDNWIYAFNPLRQHGNQWYVRIRPGIELSRDNSNSDNDTILYERNFLYKTLSIGPEIGYESKKAISLQWQRNFSFSFAYRYTHSDHSFREKRNDTLLNSENDLYDDRLAEFRGSYSLGYFPNTRTYIAAELAGNVRHGNFLYNNADGIIYGAGLNIQTSYFLGYRTRLMAGIGINYSSQDFQPGPSEAIYQYYGFNTNISCSISHNIF